MKYSNNVVAASLTVALSAFANVAAVQSAAAAQPSSAATVASAENLSWKGKKVAVFGDSLSDRRIKAWRHWWSHLAEMTGIEPLVYAQNGTQWSSVSNQVEMVAAANEDPDAFFILMGTNDFNNSIPLGEWWKVTTEPVNRRGNTVECQKRTFDYSRHTFRGRINIAMRLLKERYPDRQIVLLTPIHRGYFASGNNVQPDEAYANNRGLWIHDYVACLREAGAVWSVPVIDLFSECGLMPSFPEHAQFFNRADTDLLHPNSVGHRHMAEVIAARLAAMPATFR